MGVRAHDKALEATVELAPDEAQDKWLAGDVALADPEVRVKRGLATGRVSSRDLATALAEGWELSDDDEAAALTLRREESDATSLALGGIERTLAGATLGLSSLAEEKLFGVDPERMRARAEELGGVGDVLEVAGGIAPALLTGGGSMAAGAARAGTARALAGTTAKLVTAPSRAVVGLGRGTEALASRALAGRTGSTLVPIAGRGFVEGVGFGVGQEIDESVLGERELVAEQLAGAGIMSGLFGAGGGVLLPGIAKVGSGAARSSVAGMRRVLGRSRGVGEASRELAEAANERSLLERVVRAQARATGADEDAAGRLVEAMRSEGGLVDDVLRNEKAVTEGIARDVQQAWSLVDDQADDVMAGALSMKPQQLRKLIPAELDDVAPRDAADLVSQLRMEIDGARMYNADAPGSYIARELDRLDDAAVSAAHELGEGVDAAHAMVTLGKLRKRVGETVADTGGWSRSKPTGVSDAAWETNRQARQLYGKIREKLRDATVWGDDAAALQAQVDDSISAFGNARDAFRETFRGGFGGSLAAGGGPSADQAIKLVRSLGRFGGAEKVNALEDLLDKRLAQLETVGRHFELDDVTRGKIEAATRGVQQVKGALGKNARRAAIADDYRTLRDAEGDKSPSIHALTTMGPAVLGSLGMGLGGPVGGALGMLAGVVTRPATTMKWLSRLRVLGALDGRAASSAERLGGMVSRTTSRIAGASSAASKAAGGATGAALASPSREERRRRIDEARTRAARYATNPEAIGRDMHTALFDVDEHAPALAQAIRNRGQAAAAYLTSRVPQIVESPFTGAPPIADEGELGKFARCVEAVTDPIGVLERGLEGGMLTVEHVEAIRAVYPQMYAGLQRDLVGAALEAAGRGEPMPYRERIRLGVLFDLPLDPSITQEALARTHAVFAQASARGEPGSPPPGRPGKLSAPSQMATSLEKLATKA